MMDKLKLNISLSDRDKKILMVVLAFALLAAAFFFGYQKFMDEADKYDKERAKLAAKHSDLMQKSANKEKYIEDAKAYQDKTGIAGYTLVSNSYGMRLVAHEPFESAEMAIKKESDIFSDSVIIETMKRRQRVADTDIGVEIKERISM